MDKQVLKPYQQAAENLTPKQRQFFGILLRVVGEPTARGVLDAGGTVAAARQQAGSQMIATMMEFDAARALS